MNWTEQMMNERDAIKEKMDALNSSLDSVMDSVVEEIGLDTNKATVSFWSEYFNRKKEKGESLTEEEKTAYEEVFWKYIRNGM